MPALRFGLAETSLGPMLIAETTVGIAAATRVQDPGAFVAALRRRFPGFDPQPDHVDASWLEEVLSGGSLPAVDLRGIGPFDAAVYEVVRSVAPGETLTYGEVAALVGSPRAARAVGGAMSRCPLFPAVPCHRVVRAADGWSGWGGDVALKRRLLRSEAQRGG